MVPKPGDAAIDKISVVSLQKHSDYNNDQKQDIPQYSDYKVINYSIKSTMQRAKVFFEKKKNLELQPCYSLST